MCGPYKMGGVTSVWSVQDEWGDECVWSIQDGWSHECVWSVQGVDK